MQSHDYRVNYVNIDLRHQYGISAAKAQTSLIVKRPSPQGVRRQEARQLEIAHIYKALNCFADLQGPICYNDAQNKEMNLIVY